MKKVLLFAFLFPLFAMAQNGYSEEAKQAFVQGNEAYNAGQLSEAFSLYKKATDLEPAYAEAYINMSAIRFEEKSYKEALAYGRKAHNIEKVQYSIFSNLGKAYFMNGIYDSAVYCLERITVFKPLTDEEHYFLAAAKVGAEDFVGARVIADKLYQKNPNNSDYNVLMGNVNFGLGEYDKAIANYNKALEIKPENKFIYSNIANNYIKLGEEEKAISYIDKGIAATEGVEKVAFLILKGNYFRGIEDLDNAEKAYDEAYAIQPNNANVIVNQAAILIEKEDYKSAIEKCNLAISKNPESKEAFFNRGIANEMIRNVEQACSDWEEAFILGSEKAEKFLNSSACNE
ncbi:MAG: tetratricopeptide repeat protein [Putridiphycobacter sp.]|nr:tetratricopeptide repeat protein [Putridiphycobacter sp.]